MMASNSMTASTVTPSRIPNTPACLVLVLLSALLQVHPSHADSLLENNVINRFYSNAELNLKLATKPNWQPCQEASCMAQNAQFNQLIESLGKSLQTQWQSVAERSKAPVPSFNFKVADKSSMGTLSDSSANIMVFRGLQESGLSEHALRFLIAREMGHVVTHHHDKNVATKLLISALASVIFPAVVFVSASSAAQQASTATTIASNAASTATSLLGGEVALNKAKPSQLKESDDWAIALLALNPTEMAEMRMALQNFLDKLPPSQKNSWTNDLQISVKALLESSVSGS